MQLTWLLLGLPLALAADRPPAVMEFPPLSDGVDGSLGTTANNFTLKALGCAAGYGLCDISGYCCEVGNSVCCRDGCGPAGAQCCQPSVGGYCYAGNSCYQDEYGRKECCTDSSCTAYHGANGIVTTITQTFTYRYTITYYTYYYYRATVLQSDFDYYSTTVYIYAVNTAQASATASSIESYLRSSLSARYTPPSLPSVAPSTAPDFEPTEPAFASPSSSAGDDAFSSDTSFDGITSAPRPTAALTRTTAQQQSSVIGPVAGPSLVAPVAGPGAGMGGASAASSIRIADSLSVILMATVLGVGAFMVAL